MVIVDNKQPFIMSEKLSSEYSRATVKIPLNVFDKRPSSSREQLAPTTASVDAKAERRLLWKIDLYVYPILFVVYMMSFLDRINISNARIQGLTTDLNLVGNRFNIALFVSLASTTQLTAVLISDRSTSSRTLSWRFLAT